MLRFSKFGTRLNPFIVEQTLMNDFGSACLDCKVILSKSYFRFSRVAILRDKIACIASQHNVIYLTLTAFAYLYHFADVSKMINNCFSRINC